jgi:hypothetical protein
MVQTKKRALLKLASASSLLALPSRRAIGAQSKDPLPRTKEYIVALVRSNRADPKLRPVQRIEPVALKPDPNSSPDNQVVTDHFVGDLLLHYVFEDPQFMLAVRARDLKRLGISRESLPVLVAENYRRLYPDLVVAQPEPGLAVVAKGGNLEPCVLLDGAFWQRQEKRAGKELIAVVPSTDEVLFTSSEPKQNIELLKHLAVRRFEAAGKRAVSHTVLVWRNYRWQVIA